MKQTNLNKITKILYPLFVYYIFYNLSFSLFELLLPDSLGSLICLALAGLVTLIPIGHIYKRSLRPVPENKITIRVLCMYIGYILFVVCLGILLNIIITSTGLISSSKGYSTANSVLSDGTILMKILCNCVIIPVLEEMLYRGIICGQLLFKGNVAFAIIISSFCFGILHLNIVQFLYAFIVGLSLGFIYFKSRRLWVVIVAHGLTNLIVILFT